MEHRITIEEEENHRRFIRKIISSPKEHYCGHWRPGLKYPLYSVVENNGSFFLSKTGKEKEEPYVIYDKDTDNYYANEGWELRMSSADSRISAKGGATGGVGFGEVSARILEGEGEARIDVETSGPDNKKNIRFDFYGLSTEKCAFLKPEEFAWEDIESALSSGKMVFVNYNGIPIPLTRKDASSEDYYFSIQANGILYEFVKHKNGEESFSSTETKAVLNTDNADGQTCNAAEDLRGVVKLHKVAKTGSYSDLRDKPTAPSVPTISTDVVADKSSDAKTSSPKSVYKEIHPEVEDAQPSGGMLPNVFYELGTLTGSVTLGLAAATDVDIENEYKFRFTAGATAPTITWPSSITNWAGNCLDPYLLPQIVAEHTYEVSIENGFAIIIDFY